jgi:hypothetical protein
LSARILLTSKLLQTDIVLKSQLACLLLSEAAGASPSAAGSIGIRYNVGEVSESNFGRDSSDHGGQFNRPIQQFWSYYGNLLVVFTQE